MHPQRGAVKLSFLPLLFPTDYNRLPQLLQVTTYTTCYNILLQVKYLRTSVLPVAAVTVTATSTATFNYFSYFS